MWPLRKIRIPTRKISYPFFLKTQRRFSITSATHPRIRPVTISFAICVPGLVSSPRMTKQRDASPFRTTAWTYFPCFSVHRKTPANARHNEIRRYMINILSLFTQFFVYLPFLENPLRFSFQIISGHQAVTYSVLFSRMLSENHTNASCFGSSQAYGLSHRMISGEFHQLKKTAHWQLLC